VRTEEEVDDGEGGLLTPGGNASHLAVVTERDALSAVWAEHIK